jgi:hypothetical protein
LIAVAVRHKNRRQIAEIGRFFVIGGLVVVFTVFFSFWEVIAIALPLLDR